MNIEEYQIRVYNRSNVKQAFITSTARNIPVVGLEFSLSKIGGCNGLKMLINRDKLQGSISNGNLIEFWAKPNGGTLTRYYVGSIVKTPAAGGTNDIVEYSDETIWQQVANQIIVKYYASDAIDDIVESIIDDINANIDLSSSKSEVDIAPGIVYTIGDAEFEFISAAKAIAILANVQKSVQYGVDQDYKLYFKDLDTTVVKKLWVGKHLTSFEIIEDSSEVINDVILQSKSTFGSGFLNLGADDATSISTYGKRTKLATLPALQTPADAWRYKDGLIADYKDSRKLVSCEMTPFSEFIFPRGKVQVIKLDATTIDLPIERVHYKLDPNAGLLGRMDLGDSPIDPRAKLEEEMKRIFRGIDLNKESSVSIIQIAHTRNEEWKQSAIVDARKQGNLNYFIDTFDNTKAISEDDSYHIFYDQKRKYMGCAFDRDDSKITSISFDTGQEIDTVRIHADCDFYGRINFTFDNDISDFFLQSGSNWIISEGRNQAENVSSADTLWYKDDETFDFDSSVFLQWKIMDMPSTWDIAHRPRLWFNYVDSNNYNYVQMTNETSNFYINLHKVVSGVDTQIDRDYYTKDLDYIIKLQAVPSPSTSYVRAYTTDMVERITLSGQIPMSANNRVGFYDWYGGILGSSGYLDFFEILNPNGGGDIDIYVSRDGGTTWTQATIAHGENNVNVDISGQPSGTDLMIYAKIYHPARLYGWGFSFSN